MKYVGIILLLLMGCQNKKPISNEIIRNEESSIVSIDTSDINPDKAFHDSLYICECKQFISKLEEIPHRDSNAYRITIKSKSRDWMKSKIINTRPGMSRISYCSEFYTVVSFACGGPCYSEVFVFTNEDREDEQYDYAQIVKNNPNIIAHIRNEEFENLIIHNLNNNKEWIFEISGINYEQIDSLIIKKDTILLHFTSDDKWNKTKKINIKSIL